MYRALLRANWGVVSERIGAALERSGRGGRVEVVVVTKGHPADAVRAVREVGLSVCGENRVQELAEKVDAVGRDAVTWHFVGHLQRNKVRRALPLFDVIQSLDSLRLARELSEEALRANVEVSGLVQVNTSGESGKGGFDASAAVDAVAEIASLAGLRLLGLMTMAPLTSDDAVLRRTFARARELLEACAGAVPGFEPRHLSMGMSNDYEVAIEEGSTMVRLGTALLGERTT